MKVSFRLSLTLFLFMGLLWSCKSTGEKNDAQPSPKEVVTMKPAPTPMMKGKDKEAVKTAIEKLFAVARSGRFAEAAPLMAYRGDDKSREWKTAYNYKNAEEKMRVDKTCATFQVILDGMQKHSYTEFIQETESEGTWYVWVTDLDYADGSKEQKAFAFLKIDGKYLLGDID